jgi:hypothetical protein
MKRWEIIMIPRCFLILGLLTIASNVFAQEPAEEVVHVTIRPAAEPVPALKYEFLPEFRDQVSGNAVIHYHRAADLAGKRLSFDNPDEKPTQWLEMPARDLPLAEVRRFVDREQKVFQELELAARCDQCDWQIREAARREGFSFIFPDIQKLREFANFLKLRARVETAEGKVPEAVRTLRLGFAMARHANQADTLISSLVGAAIAQLMTDQVIELLQIPNAPNLYWALSDLLRPFIDLRGAMQAERLMVNALFPLQESGVDVRKTPLSIQQFQERLEHFMGTPPYERTEFRLFLIAITAKAYPEAKRYLLSQGLAAETVEAMPRIQVVFLFSLAEYDRLFDEMLKWQGVPYWQARAGLEKAEQALKLERAREVQLQRLPLAGMLLPAIQKVFFATAKIDRKIAAVRCIEAIRLYAAGHDGKLPGALSEITDVPIPIDPVTGKEFEYKAEEGKAVLSAPPPQGEKPINGNHLRYELTLAK